MKTCAECRQAFEVLKEDQALLDRLSPTFDGKKEPLPEPTLCASCRRIRRHAHRNERNLYHRKCDLTGKQMISAISPEKPMPVYNHHEWWGDTWDAFTYGREFDFSRPFFDQFHELLNVVPRMNVAVTRVENSEYCHLVADCKNCYLVFESSHNEDCLHGYWLQKCEDCCELSFSHECRQCYDIDNCYNCERLLFSKNCTNCSDSSFLFDCIGCRDCIFCMNLRQKQYCILNVQYTKEEYEAKKKELRHDSASSLEELKKIFKEFRLSQPHRANQFVNAENCTGDYIQESRDCFECFHAHLAEECRYGEHVWRQSKSNMDVVTVGRDAELCYECSNTGIGVKNNLFCIQCWTSSNLTYCQDCFSCQNCFGCIGLKQKKYCIFNKQYTKEEYEALVSKIISHMKQNGEWGEFYPVAISMFGYNETIANDQDPLTHDEVLKRGWQWHEDTSAQQSYLGPKAELPDGINDASDDITKQIFTCKATGKLYKIIPQELAFYREAKIPLPRLCPDERHRRRLLERNPLKLWDRKCSKCQKDVSTTYSPERPEIIYCEECYLSTIY